jgi:aldehyde:ferredoxin oxidoreductase
MMGAHHGRLSITANVLSVGSKWTRWKDRWSSAEPPIATAAIDSFGLCLFVAFAVLDIPEAFQAIMR